MEVPRTLFLQDNPAPALINSLALMVATWHLDLLRILIRVLGNLLLLVLDCVLQFMVVVSMLTSWSKASLL